MSIPIPLDKLKPVRHLVTHADCPDGVASAMILRAAYGPTLKVTFLQYETQAHRELPAEPGMLFCDFTPHRSRVQEFVEAGTIVLDHHKTQRDIVEAFGELGVYADNDGRSGASLAYEVYSALDVYELVPGVVARLARLAAIRDTWQRHSHDWEDACKQAAALVFWPIEHVLEVAPHRWQSILLEIGEVLYEKRLEAARRVLHSGVSFTTAGGVKVIVFQENQHETSDAAELDAGKHDIVVGFSYSKEPGAEYPRLTFSLRSHTGYDVGAFAKAMGGGGHAAAAGFSLRADDLRSPYGEFKCALYDFRVMP